MLVPGCRIVGALGQYGVKGVAVRACVSLLFPLECALSRMQPTHPVRVIITERRSTVQQTACGCGAASATAPRRQVRVPVFLIHLIWIVGRLNDLWYYSLTSNLWTWVFGTSGEDAVGVYGAIGVSVRRVICS